MLRTPCCQLNNTNYHVLEAKELRKPDWTVPKVQLPHRPVMEGHTKKKKSLSPCDL